LSADEVCEVDPNLHQNGNFCGTNGLFAALNILGEVPETYEQLLTAFPNVQENGCSLLQIKAYLDKKTSLHSRLLWRKDKEIAELDGTKTVALVWFLAVLNGNAAKVE
jgi:hypothetical protein